MSLLRSTYRVCYLVLVSILRRIRGQRLGRLPLSNASVELADIKTAIRMIMRRHQTNEGSYIKQYEDLFARYVGVSHAYSFLGGRVSLSAILEALEFGEGDEIIIPAFNCVVVPNALLYRGIKPIYADIDLETFNILPEEIERVITPRTRGLIIQHIFGMVADLEPILAAAKRHGLIVIEDCAHALGAEYRDRKVGTFGEAAFFSTEQSKVISTQMGGMAVTDSDIIGEKLRNIQSRSAFPSQEEIRQRLWQFIGNYCYTRPHFNEVLGTVYSEIIKPMVRAKEIQSTTDTEMCSVRPHDYGKRLPDAMAALGIRQLEKVEEYNKRRVKSAMAYAELLTTIGAKTIAARKNTKPVFLRYPLYVRDKKRFRDLAQQIGIEPGVWFTEVMHPVGAKLDKVGYKRGQCPNAEFAVENVVNLPTGYNIDSKLIANLGMLREIVIPDEKFEAFRNGRKADKALV